MRRTIGLSLALVLAAIAVWWLARPEPSAPAASVTASAPSSPEEHVPQLPSGEEPTEPAEEEFHGISPDEGPGPCIEVEVTAPGGLPEGTVVVSHRRESENSSSIMSPVKLDAGGRKRSWCTPASYTFAVLAPGFAPAFATLESGDSSTPKIRLELTRGHVLSGHLVDVDTQQPVAGARLELQFAGEHGSLLEPIMLTSDARGDFHASALAEGPYALEIKAPGHARMRLEFSLPREEPLKLELEGTAQLEGQAVDGSGAPVAGARVWVSSGGTLDNEESPGITDAQGRFTLEVDAETYVLFAEKGDLAGAHEGDVTVTRGGLVDGLVIRLRPTGRMSGRLLVRSSQQPITPASISIHHSDSGWNYSARADERGVFRAEYLIPGAYEVTVFSDGFPQASQRDLRVQAGQELTVEFSLTRRTLLEGSVTDALGRPAEHASVTLTLQGEAAKQQRSGSFLTQAQGRYHLRDLSPGDYLLTARLGAAGQKVTRQITIQEGEARREDIQLPDAMGRLEGTVRRATEGGAPLHEVGIVALLEESSSEGSAGTADERGSFSFPIMPGKYTVRAEYSETQDPGPERAVTIEAGKTARVELLVPEVAQTSGTVLDARGIPVPGASVTLKDNDELYTYIDTDEQGRFTLKASPKEVGLTASLTASQGGREGKVQGVVVGSRNVVVRLRPAAALRGRVSAKGGPPIQGFKLQAFRDPEASSLLDHKLYLPFAGDTFELVDLPAGTVELLVRTSDGRCGKATVQLEAGRTGEIEVPVGGLGRVFGRLVKASGEPHAGWLRVDPGTKNVRRAPSNQEGHFELIAIEPGTHVLDFADSRFRAPPRTFTLKAGEALDLGELRPSTPAP